MRVLPLIKALTLVPLALATGCVTLMEEQRVDSLRRQTEVENLRVEVRRLHDRVEGMTASQQDLERRADALQAAVDRSDRQTAARLQDLSGELRAAAAAREALKQDIVDTISRKMTEILNARAAAPPPRRAEAGYEHIVKTGETMSAIAAAYRTTVPAILRANDMKDANLLRVGQKLFIPESGSATRSGG